MCDCTFLLKKKSGRALLRKQLVVMTGSALAYDRLSFHNQCLVYLNLFVHCFCCPLLEGSAVVSGLYQENDPRTEFLNLEMNRIKWAWQPCFSQVLYDLFDLDIVICYFTRELTWYLHLICIRILLHVGICLYKIKYKRVYIYVTAYVYDNVNRENTTGNL